MSEVLFPEYALSPQLIADLGRMNPWWESKPLPPFLKTRRHLVESMRRCLERKLAPMVVV